jgi:hypothetical protein
VLKVSAARLKEPEMDDRTAREILARLDHIERYLADLGQVAGYAYTPFLGAGPGRSGQDVGYFDAVPASFGPQDSFGSGGWSDVAPPVEQPYLSAVGGPGVDADIVAMARADRMIEAIKTYRQRTGADLKSAKATIEQAMRGY